MNRLDGRGFRRGDAPLPALVRKKAGTIRRRWIASAVLLATSRVAAAPPDAPPPPEPVVQSAVDALAQDAREYARQRGVTLEEAMSRLRAQQESVPTTDRIAATYRDRLAGIVVEHDPAYRIVVLLTGSDPVPDQSVLAGGRVVPIVFRTGALATRDEILAAIAAHQADIRASLRDPPGMGVDPRTGELVVLVSAADRDANGADLLRAEFEALTDVPVRILALDRPDTNFELYGGARVESVDHVKRLRYACTTGFVVTDGMRTGLLTAAHCPDTLSYVDPAGQRVPLDFVGQWGARYQDVQVHASAAALRPLFYTDAAKTMLRPVTSWRNRTSTRAGDFVCHRGETTGYSCALVELVDYAPSGDLCGGPCTPDWVVVAGPSCHAGDSGGPVFSATIAFGIVKAGSYRPDGTCNFYYYMSTDYLPPGWTLLHQ
jgi:streptogrisin C